MYSGKTFDFIEYEEVQQIDAIPYSSGLTSLLRITDNTFIKDVTDETLIDYAMYVCKAYTELRTFSPSLRFAPFGAMIITNELYKCSELVRRLKHEFELRGYSMEVRYDEISIRRLPA